MTGKSLIDERVHSMLCPRCRLITINLSSGRLERSLAYHFQRLSRLLAGIGIFLLNIGNGHLLYLSADGGRVLLYNAIIVAFARLARHSVFLHYHSFSFIERRSRLMVWLVRISGK